MAKFFILSGPSGAGEDSVIAGLGHHLEFEKVITTTSRPMRTGECQGNPYYFMSRDDFEKGIGENKFVEYAVQDGGNYYGGTYQELDRVKKLNRSVIWKLDWQGAISGKKMFPDAVAIYIYIPPEVIEKRLRLRGDAEEIIKARLDFSKGWYENEKIFDYKVENKEGELDKTIDQVVEIIKKNI